jgi:uncharacterized protein YecE (DUF72 family)
MSAPASSRFVVGCTGWGYDDWKGGFYPSGTEAGEYLQRYARVFKLAEVDSTYYQSPSRSLVARWASVTPPGFRFVPKLPGAITHEAKLRNVEAPLESYHAAVEPLRTAGKLRAVLASFPPSFTREKDGDALDEFLAAWPSATPLAVELRHKSWWVPDTYRALEAADAPLVWSVSEYGRTPPVVTSTWLYARMIGDRALSRFDRVQRDLTDEMRYWRQKFEDEGVSAEEVLVLLNNHFMGHAPATAVRMHEVLGLPPPDLSAAMRPVGQSSLGNLFGNG